MHLGWHLRNCWGFDGRVGCLTYLVCSVVFGVLGVVANLLWLRSDGSVVFYFAAAPFFLISLVGSTCLLVRRFHDFDFSGYAVVLYFIAGMAASAAVAFIFGEQPGDQNYKTAWAQSLALLLWELIPLLIPGSTVTNTYGPLPPPPGSDFESEAAADPAAP